MRLGQRREEEKTNSKDHVRHVVSSIISNSVIPFHHLSTVDAQVSERLDPHPTMPVRCKLNSGNLFTTMTMTQKFISICKRYVIVKWTGPLFFFLLVPRTAAPNRIWTVSVPMSYTTLATDGLVFRVSFRMFRSHVLLMGHPKMLLFTSQNVFGTIFVHLPGQARNLSGTW